LVVEDRLESFEKTKSAVTFLKAFGAYEDVQKVIDSKNLRAGKGKMRNRRYQ
jgi:large subunit ribosomal protein L4e